MSILAVNVGFSNCISTIYDASPETAGLPLFQAWPRAFFRVVYGILSLFLTTYARKTTANRSFASLQEDQAERVKYGQYKLEDEAAKDPRMQRAVLFLSIFILLILAN